MATNYRRLGRLFQHVITDNEKSTLAQHKAANGSAQQVAVITGGAQGIGFGIATRLCRDGCHVVIVDINKDKLVEAEKNLSKFGSCSSAVVDVTNENTVNKAFQKIYNDFGAIHILVQSAGITGKVGIQTHQVQTTDFLRVFNLNVNAIFLCAKAVIPFMLKQNYGRIVNIASIAGKEGNAGMLAYSSSKAAVIGLTKVMGKEYAETGITVNAIAPAVVRTAMVDAMPDSQVKYMTDKIPMKRCGTIEEIGSVVAFVTSKEASFCTAFTFDATGGRATY